MRTKIRGSFALVLAVMIILVGWTLYTLVGIKAGYQEILDDTVTSLRLAKDVEILIRESSNWNAFLGKPEEIDARVAKIESKAEALRAVQKASGDGQGVELVAELTAEVEAFHQAFKQIDAAWQIKGLTHKVGLQGEFGKAARNLENILNDFDVAPLLGLWGQIRGAEREFRIRGKDRYLDLFQRKCNEFQNLYKHSGLSGRAQAELRAAYEPYLTAFNQATSRYQAGFLTLDDLANLRAVRKPAKSMDTFLRRHSVSNITRDYLLVRRAEKDYLLRGSKKYVARVQNTLKTIRNNVKASGIDAREKGLILDNLAVYEKAFLDLTNDDGLIAEQTKQLDTNVQNVVAHVSDIVSMLDGDAQEARLAVETSAATQTRAALIISGVVLVLMGLFAWWLSRQIHMPVARLVDALREFSSGDADLTRRVPVTSRDELGTMAELFNHFVEQIGDIVREVKENSSQLNGASGDLNLVSEEMSSNSEGMSDQASRVAVASREMNASMQTVSTSLVQASGNLERVTHATDEISGAMGSVSSASEQAATNLSTVAVAAEQASTGMDSVKEAAERASTNIATVASAAEEMTSSLNDVQSRCRTATQESKAARDNSFANREAMERLNASAREIGKVVKVINDIADQTNMLALNASIEAAGAGEAGKGFAVVANEVKELARQTGDATKMIAAQIQEIQTHSDDVGARAGDIGDVIERIALLNEDINHAVDEQNATLAEIARSMGDASQETEEVARRVLEATDGISEITRNVNEISAGIQEVTRHVTDTSSRVQQVARDTMEVSQSSAEVSQKVTAVATASEEVSTSMGSVSGAAEKVKELSAAVGKHAQSLSGIGEGLNNLLNRFKV